MNRIATHLVALLALAVTTGAHSTPQPHFLCENSQLDIFPDHRLYCEGMQNFRKGFDRQAVHLFKLSARYGSKLAQYKVGLMYAGGFGVEEDPVEGVAWLLLANERNSQQVTERLDRLLASLTQLQKRSAMERVVELRSEYGDIKALERRARWVRSKIRRVTGSRLGKPMASVRIAGLPGVTSDQVIPRLQNYEKQLRELIGTVEYRDFEVIDD